MEKEEGVYTVFKRDFYELESEIFTSFRSLMRNISGHFFTSQQKSMFEENLYKEDVCNGTMSYHPLCRDSNTTLVLKEVASFSISFIACLFSIWIINRHVLKSRIVSTIVNFLTCYIVILPCLPGIALFYAVIAVLRTYIWLYFSLFYNGKRFLAGAVDSFWCEEYFASSSASVGLYIVEGKCNPETIKKRMEKVVFSDLVGGKMERTCSTFLGFACWDKVENLDINEHVKVVLRGKSSPENPTTESQLFAYLKSIQDKPIEGKSPWETLIVPHFAYENSQPSKLPHYAVIFRLHHGIMDGVSSGNILHSIIADKPFKFSMDPLEPVGKKVSKFSTALFYIAAFFNLPHSGLNNLFVLDNQHNKFFLPGENVKGPKEFLWTRPINMTTLKKMKTATRSSIFSLMLSCMGGAYGQIKGKEIDNVEYIHSISPVALLPYPDRKPRNGFSGILFPVAINRFLKPRERLHTIFNLAKNHATQMNLIGNYYLIIMFGLMPRFLQSFGGPLVHLKCTLSNIPGPAETVRVFNGDRLSDICFWLPIKWTVGFGMGLISYGDKMRATIITDKTTFPAVADVQALKSEFENQLILLGRSVGIEEKDLFVPV